MNRHFLEKNQVVSAIVPVDLSTAANNGDWVSLKNYRRCAVILFGAAGTANDDPILTLKQATDVSGTAAKALNFTRIDVKQGTQTGIGQFTTIAQAAANTYTEGTAAENQKIWVVDVKAEDLDIDGGFDCIQVSVPDVGAAAQLGCALYILHDPREAGATLASAIVD